MSVRASQSSGVPHVYAGDDGDWPLSEARLSVTSDRHLVLHENGTRYALTARGWQTVVLPDESEEVTLRLRHGARG